MAIAPYDSAAGGPSQAATMAVMGTQNRIQDTANRDDMRVQQQRTTSNFQDVLAPQLTSSLGATGQFYGTAARKAEGQAKKGYQNQMDDLQTAFDRAHMELKRNEAFAAIGLIL